MAIRHLVTWQLAGDSAEDRSAKAEALAARLESLSGNVPTLVGIEARPNDLELDGNWDLVLIADFEDAEGLAAYQKHPDHVAVAKELKSAATARAAIDFVL